MDTQIAVPTSGWYHIVNIIVLIVVFGIFVSNAVYFRKLENDTPQFISKTAATWLFWLNTIMAILLAVLFVLTLISYFHHSAGIEAAKTYLAANPNDQMAAFIPGQGPVYKAPNGPSNIELAPIGAPPRIG